MKGRDGEALALGLAQQASHARFHFAGGFIGKGDGGDIARWYAALFHQIGNFLCDDLADAPMCATALAGDLEILVPMAGLIDVDAELARLDREIDKIGIETKKLTGKLSNPKFADNAPAEVVASPRAI